MRAFTRHREEVTDALAARLHLSELGLAIAFAAMFSVTDTRFEAIRGIPVDRWSGSVTVASWSRQWWPTWRTSSVGTCRSSGV